MGSSHQPGERPGVNELLSAVPIDEKYIAFKSAFGKYMSVNNNGLVMLKSFKSFRTKRFGCAKRTLKI